MDGATGFAYPVQTPERYGVVTFGSNGRVVDIEEKPQKPRSRYAVTGLYFYDDTAVERTRVLKPSQRGELEITDLNRSYLLDEKLDVKLLGRGDAWLDTGTHDSLMEAGQFIQTIQNRQGFKIACPEEIVWRQQWIDHAQLEALARPLAKNDYGQYLLHILNESVLP
jgi:glucose-1-phosphate thymidylyltransferase